MTPTDALALSPNNPAVLSFLNITGHSFSIHVEPIVIVAVRPDDRYPNEWDEGWPAGESFERNVPTATVDYRRPNEDGVDAEDCRFIHAIESDAIRAARDELARHVARAGEYGVELGERLRGLEGANDA